MNSTPNRSTYNNLWFAMIVSVVLYGIAAHFLPATPRTGRGMDLVFWLIVAAAAAAFAWSLFSCARALNENALRPLASAEQVAQYIVQKAMPCMFQMEAVAILGLALKIMGYPATRYIPLLAAGAVGLILHRAQVIAAWDRADSNP